jgi:hypothetical protein
LHTGLVDKASLSLEWQNLCEDALKVAVELEIVHGSDWLLLKASRKRSAPVGILSAAVSAACFVLIGYRYVDLPVLLLIAVLGGAIGLLQFTRGKVVQLRVGRLDFETIGYFGGDWRGKRSISSADVQWLEYQEDSGGIENADHPEGLYAVLRWRSVCVLPGVNPQEADMAISEIERKFPDMAKQWSGRSSFGKHITTLGLTDPK